jgi:hypothetical protein
MFPMQTDSKSSQSRAVALAHAKPGILTLSVKLRLRGHAELAASLGNLADSSWQ